MLANVLPGLREIRAPLVSGYLWLVFFFLAFHDDLPSRDDPGAVLAPVFDLGDSLSALGVATVSGVAAYLVGSAIQELLRRAARLPVLSKPVYAEAGTHWTDAGQADIETAVEARLAGLKRKLLQVGLLPGEMGVDDEPTVADVENEMPLIRTLLLGDQPELLGELDRLQAEADLRITVSVPLVFLAAFLTLKSSAAGWLLMLLPAGLLFAQGYQRQTEVGDLLAKALKIGKADAPVLEEFEASVDGALERSQLEDELVRRKTTDGSAMAAFQLGNLKAEGEDLNGAIVYLRFAAENDVVRAHAEIGIVYERLNQPDKAERAYRDGHERRDRKARQQLLALLGGQGREQEALALVKGGETEGAGLAADEEVVVAEASAERDETESYRRRAEGGDAKAALNLGLLLDQRGEKDAAVEAFEEATRLDADDPQAWIQLGEARFDRGSPLEARRSYEKAQRIQERELGPEHLDVGVTLGQIGRASSRLGDLELARGMYERALAIEEKNRPDDYQVAIAMSNLGTVVSRLGEYEKARDLHARALEIQREKLGPDHPSNAITMANLGISWNDLGEYEKSRDLLERALEMQEKNLDPDDPGLAITLGNLAVPVRNLGENERALALQERAMAIGEEQWGSDSVELAILLGSTARTHERLGRYDEAQRLHERALGIQESELGPDHLDVALTLSDLGSALRGLGRFESAAVAQRRAIQIGEGRPMIHGADLAFGYRELARTLAAMGRREEALAAIRTAFEVQRAALGEKHPELARTLEVSAEILESLDSYEQAAEARARAAKIRRGQAGAADSLGAGRAIE